MPTLPGGTDLGGLFGIEMGAEKASVGLDKLVKALNKAEAAQKAVDKLASPAIAAKAKETAELEKLAAATDRVAAKSEALAAKGIGGKAFAKDLAGLRSGFKLAGDENASLMTKMQALAGSAAFAGAGIMIVVRALGAMASALNEASIAAQTQREQIALLDGAHSSMQAATEHTISLSEESALHEQVLSHGLELTAAQFGTAAEAARQYAAVHGTTVSAGITHVVEDLTREHHSLTGVAAQAGVANTALARMAEQQRRIGPLTRNAAEEQELATEAVKHGTMALLQFVGIAPSDDLINGLRHEAAEFQAHRTAVTQATSAEEAHRLEQVAAAQAIERTADQARRSSENFATATATAHALGVAMKDAAHSGDELTRALLPGENLSDRLVTMRGRIMARHMAVGQTRELRRLARADGSMSDADINQELGSHGGAGTNVAQLRRQLAAAQAEAESMGGTEVSGSRETSFVRGTGKNAHGGYVARLEAEATFLHRMIEMQTHANQEQLALVTARDASATAADETAGAEALQRNREFLDAEIATNRAAIASAHERAVEIREATRLEIDARRAANDVHQQLSRAWGIESQQMQTAAMTTADVSVMAWGAMSNAIQSHVVALAAGRESAAEAGRGILKDSLMNLGAEALTKALFYTGEGVARAASSYGLDATAIGFFESAAIMGAVAAIGLGGGAAMTASEHKPASVGGSSGGPPRTAASVPAGSNGTGGNMTLVFNQSGIFDGKGARGMVADTLDDMSRNNAFPVSVRQLRSGARR